MICVLHFHAFIHLYCASHLGTLDVPREDVMLELNPNTVFSGPIPKMEGLRRRCHQDGANLTELTLCRISGKPRSFLSLLSVLFINAHEYNFCMMHYVIGVG
jgi:hypothetical protein